MWRCVLSLLLVILAIGGASIGFLYSGIYNIGADVRHNRPTYWLLETLRDRSIERASRELPVPPLKNSEDLIAGGQDYNEMCVDCHLKPGKRQSDIRQGLYPQPPNLSIPPFLHFTGHNSERRTQLARRQFWVIKHGIKASGMPAWGPTHDDKRIWRIVAFLQELPQLSAEQYQIITARGGSNAGHH